MPLLIFACAVLGVAALLRLAYGAGYLGVDAMWALQWGNDLVALRSLTPTNGTTPHPLSNVVAAVVGLGGRDADLWLSATTYVGAALLVVMTGLLASRLAGWAAGVGAGVIIATRPELLASTTAGMLDVWAAALICSAVALAVPGRPSDSPARPTAAMWLLLAAGLLRPEAWALALAWWAWRAWTDRALHPGQLALAVAAPLLWVLHDAVFTGDALFAIHQTDAAAGALRQVQDIASGLSADVERALRAIGSALRTPLLIALVGAGVMSAVGVVAGRARPAPAPESTTVHPRPQVASHSSYGLVWAALILFAALILAQAAIGTLVFSRFALVIAALASALVAATVVRMAPPGWQPGWALAGITAIVVLTSVGTLHDTRRQSQSSQASFSAARAALRPGVPCAPIASKRLGLSIYASRWTGLEIDEILEDQLAPLPGPATYVDVDRAASLALLRDARTPPPISPVGARPVRASQGWTVTTTCP